MKTSAAWPPLTLAELDGTLSTLHLWSQIVGKIRLVHTPWINHGWNVALYLTARGLGTGPLSAGARVFEIHLDLVEHRLRVVPADGEVREVALRPCSVAELYGEVTAQLAAAGLPTALYTTPNEVPDPVPFERDTAPRPYEPELANRLWRALLQADRVLRRFRARFVGKSSPVHLFWGAFDLAVTRFSGRPAPPHPGGIPGLPDRITREAYSHEVSSAGFWPGTPGGPVAEPAFYSYAYPAPEGFAQAAVTPRDAFWVAGLGEFVLPYAAVREAADPDGVLLGFLQSTYEAAAEQGGWDRRALERPEGRP